MNLTGWNLSRHCSLPPRDAPASRYPVSATQHPPPRGATPAEGRPADRRQRSPRPAEGRAPSGSAIRPAGKIRAVRPKRWPKEWEMPRTDGTLGAGDLELLRKDFSANPAYRLAQNAVTRVALDEVAISREIVNSTDHSLSIVLDDWKVTNQERSGRCWLFAGLNLLRVGAMKKMGLKNFEFSQNYAMFWDKVERANYFLEAVIETADRDVDDRTVAYLLDSVADDGGQWNMFVAIVRKHGLVPQAVMPETHSSSNTGRMNSVLRNLLRQGAKSVREAA